MHAEPKNVEPQEGQRRHGMLGLPREVILREILGGVASAIK
jgi:hypothetical protein